MLYLGLIFVSFSLLCPAASWAANTNQTTLQSDIRLHIVTFNTAKNAYMKDKKWTADKMDQLWHLPITDQPGFNVSSSSLPEPIYVLALQENCDHCSYGKRSLKLAYKMLHAIRKREQTVFHNPAANSISLVQMSMTKESKFCESMRCWSFFRQMGTTMIMVFARSGFVVEQVATRHPCGSNSEKGVTGVRVVVADRHQVLQSLCFASLHLDFSNSPEDRQLCMKRFLDKSNWTKKCSAIYFAGDFNMRTGKVKKSFFHWKRHAVPQSLPSSEKVFQLIKNDEMSGTTPYTGGVSLLHYLHTITTCSEPIREAGDVWNLFPTYKLKMPWECLDKPLCYAKNRPLSWTDRIICWNCGKVVKYVTLNSFFGQSDHLPVAAHILVHLNKNSKTCKT